MYGYDINAVLGSGANKKTARRHMNFEPSDLLLDNESVF